MPPTVEDLVVQSLIKTLLCGDDPQVGAQEMDITFPADRKRRTPEYRWRAVVRVTQDMIDRARERAYKFMDATGR